MKTKRFPLRATCLALLGVALLGVGLWIYPTERAYAEDPAPSAEAPDAVEAEFAILKQKARTDNLTPEEQNRKEWLGGQLIQRFMDASLGRFVLEGMVVDEEGNPLDNVSLLVSKEKAIGFDKWKEDDEKRVVDGTFFIAARGYSGVRLYVDKDGYYQEILNVFTPDPDDYRNPEEPVVDQRNIRIVLKKMGNIIDLLEEDFTLTYRHQAGVASGRVVNFDREMWPRGYYYQGPHNPILVTNLLDPEQIPPMCVYVIPKVDEDGRILSETKISGEWGQLKQTYPVELRLITSDPEGGFIVYKQQPNEQAYWAMKLAPESGYKQELVLDVDWLHDRACVKNTPYTHFYFKIDGRYGKGSIGSPRFPEGDYALEVNTTFKLQNDGSRNLDTGRR